MDAAIGELFGQLLGPTWGGALWTLVKIFILVVGLMLTFAYLTLWERKFIGYVQVRIGPNRVGPFGLLQPIADGIKLLAKEIIIPSGSSKFLFLLAPVISVTMAIAAWAVVPFTPEAVFANIDASLLYILAITSMGVYGVIIAGWASNSKYAFLGALRSAAQIVAYEIAMGFALVGVLMAGRSLNLVDIVNRQGGEAGLLSWFWLPLLPLFVVYIIAGVAETNRAPFDVAEGESEIVAGFHVEYSGMTFAVFFIAEYINILLVAMLASLMFLGGWLSPFPASWPVAGAPHVLWLFAKVFFVATLFLWFRATFPRYRYDQIMRLGWKVFIPVTLVWIVVVGAWMQFPAWWLW